MSDTAFKPQIIRCRKCEWSELVLAATAVGWLRKAGMARSVSRMSPAEMAELLPVAGGRLSCQECGAAGLAVAPWSEDDRAWPGTRHCEGCGGAIEPERLEFMPDTRRCSACQRTAEKPSAAVENEYCPRCGSPMTLRASSAGVTRYRLTCTNSRCR